MQHSTSDMILGDVMSLFGAFFYAIGNVLQEKFLKNQRDIYHYLGWLGVFGLIIASIEGYLYG